MKTKNYIIRAEPDSKNHFRVTRGRSVVGGRVGLGG